MGACLGRYRILVRPPVGIKSYCLYQCTNFYWMPPFYLTAEKISEPGVIGKQLDFSNLIYPIVKIELYQVQKDYRS